MTRWTCVRCGLPSARNLGADGYCAAHISEVYRSFDAQAWQGYGIGLPYGPARDDLVAGYADLRCVLCEATWTGPLFEDCQWCVREQERLARWRVERLLVAAEVDRYDRDDPRYTEALDRWALELSEAENNGLITAQQARAALEREKAA